MKPKKRLLIIHIDGLSYRRFQHALSCGDMPATKKLMEEEGYTIVPFRTGIPSTTPFAQAGIIYGTNHNIPSFTWFDKESGVPVRFGTMASFKHVAHKYFKNASPITYKGATIAACYPGEASETFALAYNNPKSTTMTKFNARHSVLLRWFINPIHIIDWLRYTLLVFITYTIKYLQTQFKGNVVAMKYFFANLLQEIFLHHMTRYAAVQAMYLHYPVIYAAFYAYDDSAHAFGPDDTFCRSMLHQVDDSIAYINDKRLQQEKPYDLLILSDHGQIPTEPFIKRQGKQLGEIIARWYPTYEIEEIPGNHISPQDTRLDGQIVLTYSGGLGHLYIRKLQGKSDRKQIEIILPEILNNLLSLPEIGCILLKENKKDVLITKKKKYILTAKLNRSLKEYLKQFDDPNILLQQLKRLNSFDKAGDIIFFGAFIKGKQINFENQYGGHGAFGGEQMHPFLLLKKEWNIPTRNISNAEEVYSVIKKILSKAN